MIKGFRGCYSSNRNTLKVNTGNILSTKENQVESQVQWWLFQWHYVMTDVVCVWLRRIAQVTTDKGPWAHANKVQLRWCTRGGSRAQPSMKGNSHKGLVLGDHKMGVQELELSVQASTGYYLYTNQVNSNPKVQTLLVMYSKHKWLLLSHPVL